MTIVKRLEQRRRAYRKRRLYNCLAGQTTIIAFVGGALALAAIPSLATPLLALLAGFLGASAVVALVSVLLGPFAGPIL